MTKPSTRTELRPQPALPNSKISATILDFGQPLLAPYEDQHLPIEVVRAALELVLTVWNAHVMAMPIWGKPELLAGLMDIVTNSDGAYNFRCDGRVPPGYAPKP